MPQVEIYSTRVCPYCVRAKDLLKRKGISPVEYLVDSDDTKRDEMLTRSGGRRTVPQIFINGQHVGGCDDLYALDSKGDLDRMLKDDSSHSPSPA
jgi:glutaredoxin 3